MKDAESGHWFIEVSPDDHLWKQDGVKRIPSAASTGGRSRSSDGAEYEITDASGTVIQSRRAFSSYRSNLEWFGAGRTEMLRPYLVGGATYRASEWASAVPLAIVTDGLLRFPLAHDGGVPDGGTSSNISGFVRTGIHDKITASHTFAELQSIEMPSDVGMLEMKTDSDAGTVGAGNLEWRVMEAHTDGIAAGYWASPKRPAMMSLASEVDGKQYPIIRVIEQGMYSGTTTGCKENAIELRRTADEHHGDPTIIGTAYNRLNASQINYIPSVFNTNVHKRAVEFPMDETVVPLLSGHGIPVGDAIEIGYGGLYENMLGKHDLTISGSWGFRALYNIFTYIETATGNTVPVATSHSKHAQGLAFNLRLRLTPDSSVKSNPMVVSVLSADIETLVATVVRYSFNEDLTATLRGQETITEIMTSEQLSADAGPPTENREYPASPASGSVEVFKTLFMCDYVDYGDEAAPSPALSQKHSQIELYLKAVASYDAPSNMHYVRLYLQFAMHTEEGDNNEADYLRNVLYMDNFKSIKSTAPVAEVDPAMVCELNIEHSQKWSNV